MSFKIRSFNESAGASDEGGVDSGIYTATVIEVEQPEFYAYPDPALSPEEIEAKRRWCTKFVFQIEDGPYAGSTLRTNRINFETMNVKSNNLKLWRALEGDGFDPDRKYRPSEAKGRRCRIVAELKPNGYTDITGYMALPKARPATAVNEIAGDVEDVPF